MNDKLGHLTGNRVLERIGKILEESARREGDSVGRFLAVDSNIEGKEAFTARMGGDEFLVSAEGQMTPEQAGAYATMLLHRIDTDAELNEITGGKVRISASIGVFVCPPGSKFTANQVIEKADAEMYQAKRHAHATRTLDDRVGENYVSMEVDGVSCAYYKGGHFVPWNTLTPPPPIPVPAVEMSLEPAPSAPSTQRGLWGAVRGVLHKFHIG